MGWALFKGLTIKHGKILVGRFPRHGTPPVLPANPSRTPESKKEVGGETDPKHSDLTRDVHVRVMKEQARRRERERKLCFFREKKRKTVTIIAGVLKVIMLRSFISFIIAFIIYTQNSI